MRLPIDGLVTLAWGTVPRILAVLLALVALPVLLVEGFIHYNLFLERREAEYQANLEVARAVAATFESFIRDISNQELAVGTTLSLAGDSLTPEQAHRLLAVSARPYPIVTFFNWLDPSGRVLASSEPDAVGRALGDRPYVQELVRGRQWVVSDLLQSQLTGEPMFVVARAIRDPQGQLQGMVTAHVDPRELGVVLAIPRERQGAVAIIDRQGRGVYRYPEVAWTWEQRDWASRQPMVAAALTRGEVVGNFTFVLDGAVRVGGLTPIASIGWLASANRPQELALAPLRNDLFRDVGLLALVLAAAVLLATWTGGLLTRPLRRLRRYAQAIGREEVPEPLVIERPSELRHVADAFQQTAAAIRARDAQRDQLVAILSHDLRNPLTAIRGQAQLARRRLARGDPPDRATLLGTLAGIEAAAVRLDGLLQQLRDPAFLAAREAVALRPAVVDLVELVRTAVEAQQRGSDRHPVELVTGQEALLGMWDGAALQRVLDNLLANAAKYSPPGRRIAVAVRRERDEAVCSVTDEGIGIPAADLPFIFLPHRRGQNVGTLAGSGLGLASAHEIVAQHGGIMVAQSVEGQGSTFTVRLPIRPGANPAVEEPPGHPVSAG